MRFPQYLGWLAYIDGIERYNLLTANEVYKINGEFLGQNRHILAESVDKEAAARGCDKWQARAIKG